MRVLLIYRVKKIRLNLTLTTIFISIIHDNLNSGTQRVHPNLNNNTLNNNLNNRHCSKDDQDQPLDLRLESKKWTSNQEEDENQVIHFDQLSLLWSFFKWKYLIM
jgi:hypothetical protein